MFYRLKKNSYIVRDGNAFLIHSLKYGNLCRINDRAKELLLRLVSEKNFFESLQNEDRKIMSVLVDAKFLVHSIQPGIVRIVSSIEDLNKENVSWFRNVNYLILKITTRCNAGCKYCFEQAGVNGKDMPVALFCSLIDEVLKSTLSSKITLLLFGGEPTLMPIKWYEKALEHITEAAKKFEKTIVVSMQSNLIHITPKKLELFKKFGVQLSGSIDNTISSLASYRPKIEKAINTFFRARDIGMRLGIILTINGSNTNDMQAICEWMEKKLGQQCFKA